ncbi:2690_t:CDS:2, partial [Gigaspora rosea]
IGSITNRPQHQQVGSLPNQSQGQQQLQRNQNSQHQIDPRSRNQSQTQSQNQIQNQSQNQSQFQPQNQSQNQPQFQPQNQSQNQSQFQPQNQSQSQPQNQSQSQPQNQSQSQPQNQSQSQPQNQSQSQPQLQRQPQPSSNLQQSQAQNTSNREHPKVQQVSTSEPPMQVIQRDSGLNQHEILQVPTQDAVQLIKIRNSPSPIRVVQHAPSERSITPLTPVSPFYSVIRIFAGPNVFSEEDSKLFLLTPTTITSTLIKQALHRFKLYDVEDWENYYITIKETNKDQIQLMSDDLPLEVFLSITSHNPVTLPSIRRNSTESISSIISNLSDLDEIKKLGLQNEKGAITFYLNRRSKRNSRSSGERKLRLRVLVYNDDLPVHLRSNKPHVPRTSMSVPKHLAEKAARRRSREEGKPKEKIVIVSGLATVRQIIEKAMDKFEITDGIVDD